MMHAVDWHPTILEAAGIESGMFIPVHAHNRSFCIDFYVGRSALIHRVNMRELQT